MLPFPSLFLLVCICALGCPVLHIYLQKHVTYSRELKICCSVNINITNKTSKASSLGPCPATILHFSFMFIHCFSLLMVLYVAKSNEQYSIFILFHFLSLFSTFDFIFLNNSGLPGSQFFSYLTFLIS